jgi:hypothetical protein
MSDTSIIHRVAGEVQAGGANMRGYISGERPS